jgi:hypothetical protein
MTRDKFLFSEDEGINFDGVGMVKRGKNEEREIKVKERESPKFWKK